MRDAVFEEEVGVECRPEAGDAEALGQRLAHR
jgi:hypothetical protein